MKKILFLVVFIINLFADCSDYIGGMTLNEAYKDSSIILANDPFVEIKYLDESLKDEDVSNWQIIITTNNGDKYEYNLTNSCDNDNDYIDIKLDSSDEIDAKNGTTIVLKDGDGKYIDWLKIGDGSSADDEASKCDYDYDDTADSSNDREVDIYRDPDGTGDWITKSQNSFIGILNDDGSSCEDNDDGSSTVIVNDDDDSDDGDGCDTPDYRTIKEALDAIRNGDTDASTIKVCTNENNKSAYSDILEINDSETMDNLVIKRADKAKAYYIQNDDNTPIIIDNVNGVSIYGAVIDTNEQGIQLKNNVDGFIIGDINITAGKCGVEKIHADNTFMNKFKLYGGYISSDNESGFCFQDINDTNECKNKFFSFGIKAPKFGFNMLNNVHGCSIIVNGDIDADSGGLCTDMNISMTHTSGHKNRVRSKNMGIRIGGGGFGLFGIDMNIDKSSTTSTTTTTSCKTSDSDGYGIYIDKVDADFNWSMDSINLSSNDNGVYVEGNDSSKFNISNSKFSAKNTAFEVKHSTADWNISNCEFNSSDDYALKVTGGDRPHLEYVSAESKYGIYFTDVLNMQINGKETLRKMVSTNGDGIYFAGDSANFNIQKMMIKAPNGSGIVFEGSGDKFNLQNNYFVGCKSGVYFKGSQNSASSDANLSDNFFMNSSDEGIKIDNSDNSFDLTIKNNTFFEDTAIYNDEDDLAVDSNYWGSFPFGNGKSDKDETPSTEGNAQKTDSNYLTYSPVKFEVIDYQFDECDNSDPSDTQEPIIDISAKRYDTNRYDWEVINSSLEFNKSAYVNVDNTDLSDEVSFIAWVNLKSDTDGAIIADTDNNISIENQKVSFSLNLDGTIHTITSDSLDLNKWYQVVACYDGDNMKIYINGDVNTSTSANGFIVNYDTNLSIGKGLDGYIDEPKILRVSICDSNNVKKIYEYEQNRKEYYTQRSRDKSSCALIHNKFDAVDKGKDENISTKKIGYDFDLTIKANQDFNGTVYSVVQKNDINISDINISKWNEESEKNITIKNLTQISKDSYIYIKWDDNSSGNDDGDTNSSDHFAIIPFKYIFDIPNQIKAGEKYNIEINATDNNDKNVSYTQTLDGSEDKNSTLVYIHKSGDKEDNGTIKLDFKDGVATRDDFNITDVGRYVLELNDTNYASIDKDDTPEKNRTIYGYKEINVVPYKFKVTLIKHKTSTGNNYLYHSKEHNYTLEANITALDKNDNVLTHFDKDEYATDVNATLKFILAKTDNEDKNLTYIQELNEETSNKELIIQNKENEINYTIDESNFTKGQSTKFGIIAYIEKDISNPISPIDMNITEVNTTSKEAENIGVTPEDNISFYYPKLSTEDIFTTYKETNTTSNIVVFDSNETDAQSRFSKENEILIKWYKNTNDNTTDIITEEMRENSKMSSNLIDINLTKSNIKNGQIEIEVDNNTTPKTTYGIIHLNTPEYLWYSKYNKNYDYSTNSDCINHYCIEYNYKGDTTTSYDVGSGDFKGSEVNNSLKLQTDRKGVKIYR